MLGSEPTSWRVCRKMNRDGPGNKSNLHDVSQCKHVSSSNDPSSAGSTLLVGSNPQYCTSASMALNFFLNAARKNSEHTIGHDSGHSTSSNIIPALIYRKPPQPSCGIGCIRLGSHLIWIYLVAGWITRSLFSATKSSLSVGLTSEPLTPTSDQRATQIPKVAWRMPLARSDNGNIC